MTPRQLLDDEQLSGEPTNTNGMVMEGDIVTALDISHLVIIEIVSNQKGDELSLSKPSQQKDNKRPKPEIYAQIGVHYYVVFDPQRQIQGEEDMGDALLRIWVLSPSGYQELTPSEGINEAGQSIWLDGINLGLTLWEGCFEDDLPRLWLRWCDRKGQVIFTGAEGQAIAQQRAEAERQRADRAESQVALERQRAERLAKRLRTMGLDPDEV